MQVEEGAIYAINRYQHDSIRRYDPPDLRNPRLEFSTGAGSNPERVALCDGALFVTRLELDEGS